MSVNFKRISKFRTPTESPGFLLWHVSITWRRAIEDVLKPLGLTHPQFVVLASTGWLTKSHEKVTQVDIARQAGLDPNTTSQILRGLQKKGLIKRVRSVDERSKQPTLTPAGKEAVQAALPAVEQVDQEFFSALGSQQTGFIKDLQTLTGG